MAGVGQTDSFVDIVLGNELDEKTKKSVKSLMERLRRLDIEKKYTLLKKYRKSHQNSS